MLVCSCIFTCNISVDLSSQNWTRKGSGKTFVYKSRYGNPLYTCCSYCDPESALHLLEYSLQVANGIYKFCGFSFFPPEAKEKRSDYFIIPHGVQNDEIYV